METKEINLNEIHNLPESEFKRHFAQWVEEDGVARALQAKLRKDLIETFNRTHLGRRIYAIYSKTNQMILSPLILAVNTLVAEFLYAQNCHFTLSVFSTEVPYRNTLPDFESVDTFRFSQRDMTEIFEAISNDMSEVFKQEVERAYLIKPTVKCYPSLLYLIFKYAFKHSLSGQPTQKGDFKSHPGESRRNDPNKNKSDCESPAEHQEDSQIDNSHCKKRVKAQFNNQFRYLNKYLIILSRKVKQMSSNLEQLKGRDLASDRRRRKTMQMRKMENLNKSLERISESLRICSMSKKKNRKMSNVIAALEKLAMHMEKCSENFQALSQKKCETTNGSSSKADTKVPGQEKTYSDWVKELTETKNGRKFVAKIDAALQQTLEEEKQKLAQAFKDKLQNHKNILKMKYKHKHLKNLESLNTNAPHQNTAPDEVRSNIERKLEELGKKHDELLQKMRDSECQMKESSLTVNVENQLVKEKNASARRKLFHGTTEEEMKIQSQEDPRNVFRPELKRLKTKNNFRPKLEEIVKSITEQERNIDQIIYGAKLRIQELEFESNQLDRTFQEYLQKQNIHKNHLQANVANMWNNYKTQNFVLNAPPIKCRNRFKNREENSQDDDCVNEINVDNTPTIDKILDDQLDSDEQCKLPAIHFENPFRTLKGELLHKDSSRKNENPLCSEGSDMKDMAPKSPPPQPRDLSEKFQNFNIEKVQTLEYHLHTNSDEIEQSLTPISFHMNLKDSTLDDIVVSDTKSSERDSQSLPKVSMGLKVPSIVLTKSASLERECSPTLSDSDSISQKLDISTGKQGSSDSNFWD